MSSDVILRADGLTKDFRGFSAVRGVDLVWPGRLLEFDALLPGHHMISLENGRRHVEAAARDFNRIGLPRDLLR